MPPLDWLRSFEAAARLSNFTAAAVELGLTQAAVSQHIRFLEERLKTRLFARLARGVALSPEGAAYLPHIQSAFATIGNSTKELFEPRAVQTVSIRVPISFALLVLVPALPDLAKALPRVRLDLVTIHRPTDYDQPGSALDIRFGNGSFPGREADRLTVERLVPVAAPPLALGGDWTLLPLLLVAGAREMWAEMVCRRGACRPFPALASLRQFRRRLGSGQDRRRSAARLPAFGRRRAQGRYSRQAFGFRAFEPIGPFPDKTVIVTAVRRRAGFSPLASVAHRQDFRIARRPLSLSVSSR